MTVQETVNRVLATLTPERLRSVAEEIAQTQSRKDRNSVHVRSIIDALTGTEDLGSGAQGWKAYLKLQQAIRDTADQTPGLRYVEVDS